MEKIKKVNTVLIASGSGTGANAIMEAYSKDFIANISLKKLISTKHGVACLEKAKNFGIETSVIDRKDLGAHDFNHALLKEVRALDCKLIFLVGCVVHVTPIAGVNIYNIHPADIDNFGGNKMYGLEPHKKVLLNVLDLISRGKRSYDDRFFTYPTIHEVNREYDSGERLLVASVEIPKSIIKDLFFKNIKIEEAARFLQEEVLPYEWMILPTAVKMAATKINS